MGMTLTLGEGHAGGEAPRPWKDPWDVRGAEVGRGQVTELESWGTVGLQRALLGLLLSLLVHPGQALVPDGSERRTRE